MTDDEAISYQAATRGTPVLSSTGAFLAYTSTATNLVTEETDTNGLE